MPFINYFLWAKFTITVSANYPNANKGTLWGLICSGSQSATAASVVHDRKESIFKHSGDVDSVFRFYFIFLHVGLTIWELRVAQLQVFARPGWVVLCPHGILHALDVLFEVVERAEDVLHALAVVHEDTGCVCLRVAGALGLLGRLDGQRLDHLTWGTLCGVGYNNVFRFLCFKI